MNTKNNKFFLLYKLLKKKDSHSSCVELRILNNLGIGLPSFTYIIVSLQKLF